MAAIEQNSPLVGCSLIADLFSGHPGLQIKRVRSERAARVRKPCGADLQRASIVTLVIRGLHIRKAVFLQQSRIGRIRRRGIIAPLGSTFNLPSGKLFRQDWWRSGIRGRSGRVSYASETEYKDRCERLGKMHGYTAGHGGLV